ncbi:MAG: penicillin-binding protein 2, partial [Thermoanaerobaculales bacterium]|nr:penicillin-binding protein 2 [Thermoanaerobaculales bacterium]
MELREDIGPLRRRTAFLFLLVFAALGLLHLRLADLQLVHGAQWRDLAENNRLRRLPLPGPRGWIYDRRGKVLAENVPSWELLLFPDEAENLDATGLFLAQAGVTDVPTFKDRIAERRIGRMAPLVVGEALSWSQVAAIRSHQSDFPELTVVSRFRRHYPHGRLASHVVGHLQPVSKEAVEADPGLEPDTMVGATGIEVAEDAFISGRAGERWVMVSAVGRQLGVVSEVPPRAGHDVGLTLDIELQEAAAEALGDRGGAVVALDPRSGAVRVLYSAPTFDPKVFGGRLSRTDWLALQEDPLHPLQNRCLQGVYPPGSTIKPFLALGGLAEGLIDPEATVYCNGSVVLYGHRFRCWRRGGHGFVNLERALAESCDVYFYLLGQRLGIEGMAKWLQRFGFGERTGVDLSFESSGLIGTPEWSRRVRGTPWYPGEAVSVSIGQGPVLATTIQLARAFAILANRGETVTPHIVAAPSRTPAVEKINPDHLALVTAALTEAVHGPSGTARRIARLPMAGKTGTAQVV